MASSSSKDVNYTDFLSASPNHDADRGEPSVSAGLSIGMNGDIDAMALSELINKAEAHIQTKFGCHYHAEKDRRDLVMSLPTESGNIVMNSLFLAIHDATGQEDMCKRTRHLVTRRWTVLWRGMLVRLRENPTGMPTLDQLPEWYQQKHLQLAAEQFLNEEQLDVRNNPQAAWHENKTDQVKGYKHGKKIYPMNKYGQQATKAKQSNRVGANLDVKKGPYNEPDDTWLQFQHQVKQDPGALAGFSHTRNLPKLEGGRIGDNYAYVNVARRMSIDRVLRACRQSDLFAELRPFGRTSDDKEIYKDDTWQHMSVYKIHAVFKDQPGTLSFIHPSFHSPFCFVLFCGPLSLAWAVPLSPVFPEASFFFGVTRLALAITNKKKTGIRWEIGVTDNKRLATVGKNESGARLYVECHAKVKLGGNHEKALCSVCRLFPESDFDRDSKLMIKRKGEDKQKYGGRDIGNPEWEKKATSELLCLFGISSFGAMS